MSALISPVQAMTNVGSGMLLVVSLLGMRMGMVVDGSPGNPGNPQADTDGVYPDHQISPFSSDLLSMEKRLRPRFFSTYTVKDRSSYVPSFERNPSADMKRFMPFHPLARFRGLTEGNTGGVLGNPYYAPDLDSYRSTGPSGPSPGHPVPPTGHDQDEDQDGDGQDEEMESDDGNQEMTSYDVQGPQSGSKSAAVESIMQRLYSAHAPATTPPRTVPTTHYEEPQQSQKMTAADILRYLSQYNQRRTAPQGRSRMFRFGIK